MSRGGKQHADTDIDRTKRIKEARDEAKKEIDAYRKAKEAEFRKFEAEVRFPSPKSSGYSCIYIEQEGWDIVDVGLRRTLDSERSAMLTDLLCSTPAETRRPRRRRTRTRRCR